MHGLMPPHPGPVVAVEMLKASMGLVLFWGYEGGTPYNGVTKDDVVFQYDEDTSTVTIVMGGINGSTISFKMGVITEVDAWQNYDTADPGAGRIDIHAWEWNGSIFDFAGTFISYN